MHDDYLITTQDKLHLFLKLCKKYTKKLKNITTLLNNHTLSNSPSESKEILIMEISQTIDKFNETMNNPKLKSSLLNSNDINSNRHIQNELENTEDNFYKNETSLVNTIQRLESQVRKLQNENDQLISQQRNELANLNEEMSKLRNRVQGDNILIKELENSNIYTNKLNKELETRLKICEEEKNNLQKVI